MEQLWLSILLIFVIPIFVSLFFMKSKMKIANSIIIIICVNLIVLICNLFYFSIFCLGGGVCSVTNKLENYLEFDKQVEIVVGDGEFPFPDEIPQNTRDVEYYYEYIKTLDDEINISLTFCYEDSESFKKEQARISEQFDIVSVKESDNTICYFIQNSDIVNFVAFYKNEQKITYGYYAYVDSEIVEQEFKKFEWNN